jgi:hypothetical protein
MNINDLLLVLQYHWAFDREAFPHERQRVQLSLLLLMAAYTATRPGALVESGCARGSNRAICYKDINLLILSNPNPGERDLLVMEVTLVYRKGDQDGSKP